MAIDISTQKIRLMKLKRSGSRLIPAVYKEIEIDKKYNIADISNQKDLESDTAKALIEVLKKLKQEFKLKYVVVSLPEIETYIFKSELPKEAESDIASAIKFSLEENVPLSIDEANFDYAVLPVTTNKPFDKIEVVVNVFPKALISIYTEILKSAGLFPLSFLPESTAVAKAVIQEGDIDPYLLIRLLDDRVNVAVAERGIVQYESSIAVNPKDVLAQPDGDKAFELRSALNKLLVFWFTGRDYSAEHKKIQTAFVLGEGSTSAEIQEFLERHLKINVETADVWANCFDLNEYVPEMHEVVALNYAVAIGLAVEIAKYS